MYERRRSNALPLAAVATAYAAYAGFYISRLSFLVEGTRYFTLADDQMISMRYAENLANGHGLTWNSGEPPVEGFTNFVWVLYMAVFHLLDVSRPLVSLFIQATGAALLLVNLALVWRIAALVSRGARGTMLGAVVLTAFYVPLSHWAFQGTEVSLLTAAVSLGALLTLGIIHREASPVPLYALLALTTLVRPDMVVFGVTVIGALMWTDQRRWRTHLTLGGGSLLLIATIAIALRLVYFDAPLPNTYYLKMTGFPPLLRVLRGAAVALIFLLQLLPAAIVLLFRGKAEEPAGLILLGIFAAQVAYSVFVGGDAWEWYGGSNRFISIAMPLLFTWLATRLSGCFLASRRVLSTVQAGAVAGITVVLLNVGAFALDREGPLHRITLDTLPPEIPTNQARVRAGLALREFTTPEALVAVSWAGAIPYYSQRRAVDLLGKMDRVVARGPMHMPPDLPKWLAFNPGHLKWEYAHSIGRLQPDVIEAPLWRLSAPSDIPPDGYIEVQFGGRWYIRRQSPRVRWEQLSAAPAER